MKIFLVGNVASMMINFRKELIISLSKDHDVYCLASDYDDKSKKIIKEFGATAISYKLNSKGINPFKDVIATYGLVKIFKKHKPNIVFNFFVKPVIFSTIAAKIAGVKRVVGMIEGAGNAFTYNPNHIAIKTKVIKFIQILLYKLALPLLNTLILLNNDDKKDIIDDNNIKLSNIQILGPIGLDLSRFKYTQAPISPVSFLFVGRLLAEKGLFEYLKAAKIIKKKYPDTIFKICGSFDKTNHFALNSDVLNNFVKDNVIIYEGFVDDIYSKLKDTSVFVLPSYREGFPRSTQEAMATGRAIITTNVVGCKETVINGENGFLVPPYDHEALSDKMEEFIKNTNLINSMGVKSREIADLKYDIYKINKRLIKIILGRY